MKPEYPRIQTHLLQSEDVLAAFTVTLVLPHRSNSFFEEMNVQLFLDVVRTREKTAISMVLLSHNLAFSVLITNSLTDGHFRGICHSRKSLNHTTKREPVYIPELLHTAHSSHWLNVM